MLRTPEQIQASVDAVIQSKLLSQTSQQMGFLVPDAELLAFIKKAPDFQQNGKFDAEAYRTIPNRGLFEKRQRSLLAAQKLQAYVLDRVRLTPEEIKRQVTLSETKVTLSFAKIDFNKLSQDLPLPKERIVAFLKETPPAKLKEYYDSHGPDFTVKPPVKLKQIRIGLAFQASAEKRNEAKNKIDNIRKQLTAQNFSEMAQKNSDDEYAKQGGDRGMVDRKSLSPALAAVVDSLKTGEISAPVETPVGYFILFAENKPEDKVRSFEEVKEEIGKILAKKQGEESFKREKLGLWNKILASGGPIEKELKDQKITVESTNFSLADDNLPKIGSNAESILEEVAKLTEKAPVVPRLVEFNDNFYYLKLQKLEKPKEAELTKKKTSAAQSLTQNLQNQVFRQWVASLETKAKIDKKPLFENK